MEKDPATSKVENGKTGKTGKPSSRQKLLLSKDPRQEPFLAESSR